MEEAAGKYSKQTRKDENRNVAFNPLLRANKKYKAHISK